MSDPKPPVGIRLRHALARLRSAVTRAPRSERPTIVLVRELMTATERIATLAGELCATDAGSRGRIEALEADMQRLTAALTRDVLVIRQHVLALEGYIRGAPDARGIAADLQALGEATSVRFDYLIGEIEADRGERLRVAALVDELTRLRDELIALRDGFVRRPGDHDAYPAMRS